MQVFVLFKEDKFVKATSNAAEAKAHGDKKDCRSVPTMLRKDFVKQNRWAQLPEGLLVISAGETKFTPNGKRDASADATPDAPADAGATDKAKGK